MYQLSRISKKKFTYQDVLETFPELDYEGLCHVIQTWMAAELIAPIRKDGMTSFRPAVYHTYKKLVKAVDYSQYTKEIKVLHPKLNISRYLMHPDIYLSHREYLGMLSEFLWKQEADLDVPMSINEKSYVIWRDEKYLASKEGQRLLVYNGLLLKEFGCYQTPEPYFSTVYNWDFAAKAVIIIENKDTWYTISKVLKESAKKQLCGIPVAMLIYGEGNKAARSGGITEFLADYPIEHAAIYYFGDIDIAGIDIYERVLGGNRELNIRRFMPGYREMIRKAAGVSLRETEDKRDLCYTEEFLAGFSDDEQLVIRNALRKRQRIPQEILSYQDYQQLCE